MNEVASSFEGLSLDCRGMKCPRPIIEVARRIGEVSVGSLLELLADDPAAGPRPGRLVPDAWANAGRLGCAAFHRAA